MSLVQHIQQILNSPVSLRAQILGTHIAINATQQEFWIKQQNYADIMHCSRSTVSRALKELVQAGLLTDMKKRHLNRYKIYQVKYALQNLTIQPPTPPKKERKKTYNELLYQRISLPFPQEKLNPKAKQIFAAHKDAWTQKFPLLDGQNSRPFLIACVEEATQYMLKNNHQYDPIDFVDIYLKSVTNAFCQEPIST